MGLLSAGNRFLRADLVFAKIFIGSKTSSRLALANLLLVFFMGLSTGGKSVIMADVKSLYFI